MRDTSLEPEEEEEEEDEESGNDHTPVELEQMDTLARDHPPSISYYPNPHTETHELVYSPDRKYWSVIG